MKPEQGDAEAAAIAALEERLRKLRAALGNEEARRREILASTSWRITAPLRILKASGWRQAIRNVAGSFRSVERTPAEREKPFIPAAIRADHVASPEQSNDTYRLIDAQDALRPLVRPDTMLRAPTRTRPRIFLLGSNELALDLAFDADVARATHSGWRTDLSPGRFDYLLVETIWHIDNREWRYSLVRDSGDKSEFLALVERCRELSVPIVLWFREGVGNYGSFAWLGEHADRIYGIDEAISERLKRDFPTKPVAVLPVAVQPVLDNPTRSYALREAGAELKKSILYDGWWELRQREAELHALEALRTNGLLVCESNWEFPGVRLEDNPGFSSNVIGCVDRITKSALNKMIPFEVFFEDSFRLPWRQRLAMLRAAASGALVVAGDGSSGASLAQFALAGDMRLEDIQRLRGNELECAARAHSIRRRILEGHCVRDRLDTIALDLGLHVSRDDDQPRVAMVLVTMRPQLLAGCIERFRAERYPNKELIVVMHGDFDRRAAEGLVQPGESIRFMGVGRERSLGACLNQAIAESDCPYWSKMDDDDIYGANYLYDLMLSRRAHDFHVAGKPPAFAYLQREDALYWDPAWADHAHLMHASDEAVNALVAGGTITARREIIDQVPFSETRRGGSDSDFIRRCYENGHGLLATDGFNFVRYRSSDGGFHTWNMDERELRMRARAVGSRADVERIAFV